MVPGLPAQEEFDIADECAVAVNGDVPVAVAPGMDLIETAREDAEEGQIVRPLALFEDHVTLLEVSHDTVLNDFVQRLRSRPVEQPPHVCERPDDLRGRPSGPFHRGAYFLSGHSSSSLSCRRRLRFLPSLYPIPGKDRQNTIV